jgi:hypothetical protein
MPQTSSASIKAPIVSNNQGPLSTLNLLIAGVPVKEVIWFRRLEPDRKMVALRTWRGQLLLERVRDASATTCSSPSMATAA